MKTIINALLAEEGFTLSETDFGSAFSFEEDTRRTYWLIVRLENLDSVLETQSEYFQKTKELFNTPWFDKNANLLILYETSDISDIKLKSQIIEVEEDPYLFKKQVLLCSDRESEYLKEAITASGLTVKDFIEGQIISPEIFLKHKNNFNTNNYESLIYRIPQKIPFIKLKFATEHGLETLNESHRNVVDNSIYAEMNQLIEDNYFELSTEDLKNITAHEIYHKLLNSKI